MPYPFWQLQSMNWVIESAPGNLPNKSSTSHPTIRSPATSCAVCNESSAAMLSIGETPIDLPGKGLVYAHDLPSHGGDAKARLEALARMLENNPNQPSLASRFTTQVGERIDIPRFANPEGPAFFHHPL